jgi:hypothetical protein
MVVTEGGDRLRDGAQVLLPAATPPGASGTRPPGAPPGKPGSRGSHRPRTQTQPST